MASPASAVVSSGGWYGYAVTGDGSQLGSLHPVKITGGDSRIVVSPVSGASFSVSWEGIVLT